MSTTASVTRRPVTALAATVALGVGMSLLAVPAAHAEDIVPSVANPPLGTSICGLDVVLAIDASNSIKTPGFTGPGTKDPRVNALKAAALKIAASFADKNTRLSVVTFNNDTTVRSPLTSVTGQSVQPGGSINTAITGYTSGQGSSGEGAFDAARAQLGGARANVGKLILLMSDGKPNAYNGHPNTGAVNNKFREAALNAGITSANAAKNGGARVLGIGFGLALNPNGAEYLSYVDALKRVSGPKTVTGTTKPNVRTDDLVLQSDLTALAGQLSTLATQAINGSNCSFLALSPSNGTVTYKKRGVPVNLTASLRSPTSALAGQQVTFYTRTGSVLGTKTTNSAGQAVWPVTVTANQQYYAKFAGSGTSNLATQSGVISVLVAPKVKAKVSKSSLGRHSALLTFSGKIKPKTVKKVFLQRKDHGTWTTIAKKKAKKGKYTVVQVVTKKKSKWRIATKKNASYTVGYSKTFKVKV